MGNSGTTVAPGGTTQATSSVTQTSVPGVVQAYGTYLIQGFTTPVAFASGVWAQIDKTWYLTWEYPAHQKVNANIGNPNYTLSASQVQQYVANYLDVSQFSTNADTLSRFKTQAAAVQYHWQTYGAIERRTFLPQYPPFNVNFVPPPTPPKTQSSGGGSWLTSALSIAGSVVALLGPNDPLLNAKEQEVLFTGSAVIKQVLPYYYKVNPKLADAIEGRLTALLTQYA
jgi:hypothetical protein